MTRSKGNAELSVHRLCLVVALLSGGVLLAAVLGGCEGTLTPAVRLVLNGGDGGPGSVSTLPPPPVREPDPAQPDPAQPDPAQPDPAQPDPAQPDPAQPDPTQPDPA